VTNPRLKGVEIGREKGVAIGSDLTDMDDDIPFAPQVL